MKKIFLLLLIFVSALNVYSQSTDKENRIKFDPSGDSFKDLEEAIKEAQKTNRRIILDVGGEWCIWCHRIDEFIDKNEEIKNILDEKFIVVKINYSEENKNEKFLAQFPKVEGYPHFFVLSKKGKLLHSQNTGLLEKDKSYDLQKFVKFLKKWSAKK